MAALHFHVLLWLYNNLADEIPPESVTSTNLLADLQYRYYAEQDCLIGQLRSHDARGMTQKDKWLHLVLKRTEMRRAEKEEWFDQGALSIGLFERAMEGTEKRSLNHKYSRIR